MMKFVFLKNICKKTYGQFNMLGGPNINNTEVFYTFPIRILNACIKLSICNTDELISIVWPYYFYKHINRNMLHLSQKNVCEY